MSKHEKNFTAPPQHQNSGMRQDEIPIGLGMALAMNTEAMQKFASLSESKKREIIKGTHAVSSKEEMQQYVERIISD